MPTTHQPNHSVELRREKDITKAVHAALRLAQHLGMSRVHQTMLATATSELATNVIRYAGRGCVELRVVDHNGRQGIEITVEDQGPGIADLKAAMTDHVSTTKSLGIGLPGARRLTDELAITSELGKGTKVVARKWR